MDYVGFVEIAGNKNNEIEILDKIRYFRIFVRFCPNQMDGHGHTPIGCVQLSIFLEELK